MPMKPIEKEKTATVAEMVERFRTAPPTSRAIREAMRKNGDVPIRMWYENEKKESTLDHRNDETVVERSELANKMEIGTMHLLGNEIKKRKQGSKDLKKGDSENDSKYTTWRSRFRNI